MREWHCGPVARDCRDGRPTGAILSRQWPAVKKHAVIAFGRKVFARRFPSSCSLNVARGRVVDRETPPGTPETSPLIIF
jgi:hypothetical protein